MDKIKKIKRLGLAGIIWTTLVSLVILYLHIEDQIDGFKTMILIQIFSMWGLFFVVFRDIKILKLKFEENEKF